MNNNEIISHHGILGQKWGIRRYQNADGSLTPAGRKRAQKLKGDYKQLTGKKLKGKIPDEDPSSKPVRKLTDMELKDRINRLTAEKQALSLERDLSSNGQKFVRSVGKDVVAPAAISAGKQLLERFFIDKGAELMGLNKKEVKSAYQQLKEDKDMAKWKRELAQDTDWLKKHNAEKKQQKENQNNQNTSKENTDKDYVYVFFKDKAEQNRYANSGKKVYDAVWEEKSSTPMSSQLLLEDKRRGQKLLNFYDR